MLVSKEEKIYRLNNKIMAIHLKLDRCAVEDEERLINKLTDLEMQVQETEDET